MPDKTISEIYNEAPAATLTGEEILVGVQSGGTVGMTAQDIADLHADPAADPTIFTSNGTIADGIRIVEIPQGGTLYFGKRIIDDTIETVNQNCFFISDDGGVYLGLVFDGQTKFTLNSDGSISAWYLNVVNSIVAGGSISGKRGISPQVSNFTSAGDSGTRYTDEGSGTGVQTTLSNTVGVGTIYHYSVVDSQIRVYTDPGETLVFWDGATTQVVDTDNDGSFFHLQQIGMSATIEKVSDSKWMVTSNNGGIWSN